MGERKTLSAIRMTGAMAPHFDAILTQDAQHFLFELHQKFGGERKRLLAQRKERARQLDAGLKPDFLAHTEHVRNAEWKVAPIPKDLLDRRVEITGPAERKMIINALNSGARVFMADLEDSSSPTWFNSVQGQVNLWDAVRRTIEFTAPNGKQYRLQPEIATLLVRPRGWHLPEKHFLVDGEPMSGSLFDFGLYFFHNVKELMRRGTAPYFYLPKIENHEEARLWNLVFLHAESALGVPAGTIRGTVLIETILAAFEMNEILFELREHSAGLNCGRWDYIFSYIKKFHRDPRFLVPDRAQVTMTTHFLRSYSLLLIQTCHRRGIHAMGGMAAQIPIKDDAKANEEALAKVRADKEREVNDGHDGTWVAHPGLVPIATEIFDRGMSGPNQIHRLREDVRVTAEDLLRVPGGTITEAGLRTNVSVGLQYVEAWLRGIGCVPINNLMEDAATAEISRTQLWQWVHDERAKLSDGRRVSVELFRAELHSALESLKKNKSADEWRSTRFDEAAKLYDRLVTAPALEDFLTLPASEILRENA